MGFNSGFKGLKQKNVTSIRLVILYCHLSGKVRKKTLKFIIDQAWKAQRASRGIDLQAPAVLSPGKRPDTHFTGGWVGPRAGLDGCGKYHSYRDSILLLSSPYRFTTPTTLPRPPLSTKPVASWLSVKYIILFLINTFIIRKISKNACLTSSICRHMLQ